MTRLRNSAALAALMLLAGCATQVSAGVSPQAPGFLGAVARLHLPGRLVPVADHARRRGLCRAEQRRLV